eukprot:1159579-Pelagomonas_calceolata.AAC.3
MTLQARCSVLIKCTLANDGKQKWRQCAWAVLFEPGFASCPAFLKSLLSLALLFSSLAPQLSEYCRTCVCHQFQAFVLARLLEGLASFLQEKAAWGQQCVTDP